MFMLVSRRAGVRRRAPYSAELVLALVLRFL